MIDENSRLSYRIRGAIYEVAKGLGPGLLEECYHQALLHELRLRGMRAESRVKLPVIYKGVEIKNAYELDILVEDTIIIELKSVESLNRLHYKQLMNYLHLKDRYIGYLVNFNCEFLEDGISIQRIFNNQASDRTDY